MVRRECRRYFENAKDLLKKFPIEENRYEDMKYVQEACGTAYLTKKQAYGSPRARMCQASPLTR